MDTLEIADELIFYFQALSSRLKGVLLLPISDAHRGNPLFSEKHFLQTLAFVKGTPSAYAIVNGDLCESSVRTSKGEIYRQVGSPEDQRDWMIEHLLPIKHKILGMTTGNHELRIQNEVGIDISKDIARALGVPYRASGMLLKISFGSGNNKMTERPYTYFVYFTHGYGGARTKAAKAVKVERLGTWIHADCYIMSHDHVVNAAPDVYLMPDPRTSPQKDSKGNETGFMVGKVTAHRKSLVKSNAYLKWGGYAEMGGFPPVDLECPIIKLAGTDKPKVKVEV